MASLIISMPSYAGPKEDEDDMFLYTTCSQYFLENKANTYEADQKAISKIGDGMLSEVKQKYSKHDNDVLQANVLIRFLGKAPLPPKFDLQNFCRNFIKSQNQRKSATGSYFAKD